MSLFGNIVRELGILQESVSAKAVNLAIDGMHPASIRYNSGGDNKATGYRVIYPVAYGLSKAGNPVVRAFETGGDTASENPGWKFFRLDRVLSWKTLAREFNPNSPELIGGMSDFNKNGDNSMSQVYNISPIGNAKNLYRRPESTSGIKPTPITKSDVENAGVKPENPVSVADANNSYSPTDIVNGIVSDIGNDKNSPENVDKTVKTDYNSIENNSKLDTRPITKTDVNGGEPKVADNSEGNKQMETAPETKPITKGDISGEEEAPQGENELTKKYKDMLDRMNTVEV